MTIEKLLGDKLLSLITQYIPMDGLIVTRNANDVISIITIDSEKSDFGRIDFCYSLVGTLLVLDYYIFETQLVDYEILTELFTLTQNFKLNILIWKDNVPMTFKDIMSVIMQPHNV